MAPTLSTPEEKCIGFPEQRYISGAVELARDADQMELRETHENACEQDVNCSEFFINLQKGGGGRGLAIHHRVRFVSQMRNKNQNLGGSRARRW
ncbi:MAG: hypothetical protein ABSG53_16410, partial [Thermoguttaceae bacterium]